jgi:hypothetical protein
MAPIAPEPPLPEGSIPLNDITTIDEATLCESVAVTVTLLKGDGANALQISEVPCCTFVRLTSVQVNPPPATLFTLVFVPER